MTLARRPLLLAITIAVAGFAAGCGATAPSPPPSPDRSAPVDAPPGDGGDGGVVTPPNEGGGGNGGPGGPEPVVPEPGQLLVHPVPATSIEARVSGRHVVLNARWWSGVEPCAVLDSVGVARDGQTITITLLEGTSDADVACIAIAVEKVTVIDLGELEPGRYTVVADPGEAAAVTVEVP